MEIGTNETGKFAKKREEVFHHDVEAIQLINNSELVRRFNLLAPELLF